MPSFRQKNCCSHTQPIFQCASALIYYRPVPWQKLLKILTFHKCEKFSLIDTIHRNCVFNARERKWRTIDHPNTQTHGKTNAEISHWDYRSFTFIFIILHSEHITQTTEERQKDQYLKRLVQTRFHFYCQTVYQEQLIISKPCSIKLI